MKKYQVDVELTIMTSHEVEADSAEEAREIGEKVAVAECPETVVGPARGEVCERG